MAETDASPPPERRTFGCLRALVILIVTFTVAGVMVLWKFEGLVRDGLSWLQDLPKRMVTRELTDSFRQSLTDIQPTKGDILEVAVMQTDETVTRKDSKSLFNEMVSLGTTVSEIRTPVVYRYHIKLSDPWHLKIEGTRCIVECPELRATQPPAIETQGLQKRSEAGWLRFNAAENLEALERDLTPTLVKRATEPSNLKLVRDPSRKSIAEFVRTWLLKQDPEATTGVDSVVVLFPDEVAKHTPPAAVPLLPVERP